MTGPTEKGGKPNPGSQEALDLGCRCPVFDNCHGKFPPWPPTDEYPEGCWYINGECPIHVGD